MSDLINQLREPEIHYPGNFDTVKRANAMLMCMCQEAADALEAQAKEISELKTDRDDCLELSKLNWTKAEQYRLLCDQMGAALERCTKYTNRRRGAVITKIPLRK